MTPNWSYTVSEQSQSNCVYNRLHLMQHIYMIRLSYYALLRCMCVFISSMYYMHACARYECRLSIPINAKLSSCAYIQCPNLPERTHKYTAIYYAQRSTRCAINTAGGRGVGTQTCTAMTPFTRHHLLLYINIVCCGIISGRTHIPSKLKLHIFMICNKIRRYICVIISVSASAHTRSAYNPHNKYHNRCSYNIRNHKTYACITNSIDLSHSHSLEHQRSMLRLKRAFCGWWLNSPSNIQQQTAQLFHANTHADISIMPCLDSNALATSPTHPPFASFPSCSISFHVCVAFASFCHRGARHFRCPATLGVVFRPHGRRSLVRSLVVSTSIRPRVSLLRARAFVRSFETSLQLRFFGRFRSSCRIRTQLRCCVAVFFCVLYWYERP